RAGSNDSPALRLRLRQGVFLQFPFRLEIRFVQEKSEGYRADTGLSALVEQQGVIESSPPRAIDDQEIPGGPAEVGWFDTLETILARDIPDHEEDVAVAHSHELPIHSHSNRGQVTSGEGTFHEASRQTGLADGETSEQADLLSNYGWV